MFGRQVGKSVTMAAKLIAKMTAIPFYFALYVAPTEIQMGVFSNDRFKPMAIHSPAIKNYFMDSYQDFAVREKKFTNGSCCYFRSCYNTADTIRSITADDINIDEVQDIMYDNIFVIRETGSARQHPVITYCGTPKTLNNTLGRLWKRSTQNEWAIPCPGCNKFNIIGIDNLGKTGIICAKCGHKLNYMTGQWVQTNKTADPITTFPAFRIPQPCTPWHQSESKWNMLLGKMESGNIGMFHNEVLAQPYDVSENPVSEAEVEACCDVNRVDWDRNIELSQFRACPIYAGVDYGRGTKSFTILTIIARVGDRSRVLFAKKYLGSESNPLVYIEDIVKKCKEYHVRLIGADAGDGSMQNAWLQDKYGSERVRIFEASDSLGQLIKPRPDANKCSFNRTANLQNRFLQIKNKLVSFPNFRLFKPFSDMITCVFIDYAQDGRKVYYDHDGDNEPDDFLHAWNYAEMCSHMIHGRDSFEKKVR